MLLVLFIKALVNINENNIVYLNDLSRERSLDSYLLKLKDWSIILDESDYLQFEKPLFNYTKLVK